MVLDAKEYLHLAVNAINQNEHHAALNYLKEVLVLEPENANALYLLAAEHAELGLFDRAISEMEQALTIDPHIDMARFQLGLLYLYINQSDKAAGNFAFLSENTSIESLRTYAEGMIAICSDNLQIACEKLALGLSKGNDNPALKKDMQSLLDKLLNNPQNQTEGSENSSIYLGAYGNKSEIDSL